MNNPGGGWFANAANADEFGSRSEGVKRKGSEGARGVGSRSSCPNLGWLRVEPSRLVIVCESFAAPVDPTRTPGNDCLKRSKSSSEGFCEDCLLRNIVVDQR